MYPIVSTNHEFLYSNVKFEIVFQSDIYTFIVIKYNKTGIRECDFTQSYPINLKLLRLFIFNDLSLRLHHKLIEVLNVLCDSDNWELFVRKCFGVLHNNLNHNNLLTGELIVDGEREIKTSFTINYITELRGLCLPDNPEAVKKAKQLLFSNYPQLTYGDLRIKSKYFSNLFYIITQKQFDIEIFENDEFLGRLCIIRGKAGIEKQPLEDLAFQKILLAQGNEKELWKVGYFHPTNNERYKRVVFFFNGKLWNQL